MKKIKEMFAGFGAKSEKHEAHGCCSIGVQSHHNLVNSDSKIRYQCPMECEGEKIYETAEKCPVCNMNLSVVD
jgi:Cu2+-exporting ATPase